MPRAARLLLLLHVVAAAERRRLGDTLDKEGLRNLADNGALGTEIRFKLDAADVDAGARAALAAKVAADIDCEGAARRVFRSKQRTNLILQRFATHTLVVCAQARGRARSQARRRRPRPLVPGHVLRRGRRVGPDLVEA